MTAKATPLMLINDLVFSEMVRAVVAAINDKYGVSYDCEEMMNELEIDVSKIGAPKTRATRALAAPVDEKDRCPRILRSPGSSGTHCPGKIDLKDGEGKICRQCAQTRDGKLNYLHHSKEEVDAAMAAKRSTAGTRSGGTRAASNRTAAVPPRGSVIPNGRKTTAGTVERVNINPKQMINFISRVSFKLLADSPGIVLHLIEGGQNSVMHIAGKLDPETLIISDAVTEEEKNILSGCRIQGQPMRQVIQAQIKQLNEDGLAKLRELLTKHWAEKITIWTAEQAEAAAPSTTTPASKPAPAPASKPAPINHESSRDSLPKAPEIREPPPISQEDISEFSGQDGDDDDHSGELTLTLEEPPASDDKSEELQCF